ncbi:DUF190 domain-containing protein [Streptomyces xinghaiensis]|nr:DUF190 domain-containing protein [Streptomyces xinghaiensis]MZE81326.1 DUF190 domain-containing protein [Streptomyces sp. SID5475]
MQRLTIFIRSTDVSGRSPLDSAIIRCARQSGLRGMTVIPCVEGFGRARTVRRPRWFTVVQDHPLMLVAVDTADRIAGFRTALDRIAPGSLVVVDEVTAV